MLSATHRETPHPPVAELVTGHFREGKGYAAWRANGTRDWLLVYTLDGRGRFGHAGGDLIAEAGDIVLLRPGTRHDYGVERSLKRWELIWAHFVPRPAWHDWLDWPEVAPGLLHLPLREPQARAEVARRFMDVHHLATGARRRREAWAMNALEVVLLWCDTQNPHSERAGIDPRIRAVMDYLCRDLSERVRLADAARIAALSVSRLSHLFREEAGATPRQYLETQRINRAKALLTQTSHTVQAIAAEVGFENPFYFTLRFRGHTGLSPREYRRQSMAAAEGAQETARPAR